MKNSAYVFLWMIVSLTICLKGQSDNEVCATLKSKRLSQCTNLVESCPFIYHVVKTKAHNPRTRALLRKLHCGFDGTIPKVCCPIDAISIRSNRKENLQNEEMSAYVDALPAPPVCGRSTFSPSRGSDANLGDFPWMVIIGFRSVDQWKCGGSIITSRHVITAAHCVVGTSAYIVRLGELDYAREDEGAIPVDILIKYKIIHEEYDSFLVVNDIAILILEHDIQFTDLMRPICMPLIPELRNNSFDKYRPLVAGWGKTKYNGISSTHLKFTQLPVISVQECQQAYRANVNQTIDQRTICAGFKLGMKDACEGDSGGPLMQQRRSPWTGKVFFYQIGIVSFGRSCALPGVPGVYTRVTEFLPWILKKVTGRT